MDKKPWEPKNNPFSEYHCQACEFDRVTSCSGCSHDAYAKGVRDTARSMVEWLIGDCLEHSRFMDTDVAYRKRYECASCWQSLRQGMEEQDG